MRRTTIYLSDEQFEKLRALGKQRSVPVARLLREAVEAWLKAQSARELSRHEWERRFDELLERRTRIAKELGFSEQQVERDVMIAVREVREARRARR
jgi:hypothetical protein